MAHLNLGLALMEKTPQDTSDLERAEKALRVGGRSGRRTTPPPCINISSICIFGGAIAEGGGVKPILLEAPNVPDAAQVQEMIARVKKAATAQAQPPKQP